MKRNGNESRGTFLIVDKYGRVRARLGGTTPSQAEKRKEEIEIEKGIECNTESLRIGSPREKMIEY